MPDHAGEKSSDQEVRTIHKLVRLMHQYDLTAVDLIDGGRTIRLRRGRAETASALGKPAATNVAAPGPPAIEPEPKAGPEAERPVIESPMVGTYYASNSPEAPPFVNVGTAVRPETIVCVIEAMKVFTEIPARVSGTIAEVLVKNGQPVEFGQPLFRVSP